MQTVKSIAQALHEYRMQRGWKYRQLAAYTGIPLPTLHAIIKRGQNPTDLTLHKLAKTLPGLFDSAA